MALYWFDIILEYVCQDCFVFINPNPIGIFRVSLKRAGKITWRYELLPR